MNYILVALKGAAMGAANVIPGVSGGTIAFITGIYERLIDAIKAFDLVALKLLVSGKFKTFAAKVDLSFLLALFLGIGISILSLAKLLTWAFEEEMVLTMAFFFGLILASIYLVGKQIERWNATTWIMLLIGIGIACGLAFLKPAAENSSSLYIFLCGVVAISSMILPGLSGSYVLLIMGNYILILNAVNDKDIGILIPLAIGCAVGLIAFSWIISYIFKHFKDGTIALLTGFVAGSLLIIWPWKNVLSETRVLANGETKLVDTGYDWFTPEISGDFWMALLLIIIGAISVVAIEHFGTRKQAEA